MAKSDASPYKDEPQPKPQPEPQQSHTHTDTVALPFAPTPAHDSVCVSEVPNPEPVADEDFLAYARAHKSFTEPEAWALKHANLRDAISVQLVREWKAGRAAERLAEARAAVPDGRLTFFEAAQAVVSVVGAHGRDPCAFVEELYANGTISDEVRGRLLERFAPAERAAGA